MAKTPKVASTRLSLPLGVAGTEPDSDPEGSLAYATDTGRVRVKQAGGWADVSGGGGAPTGPAGGDLAGTYPNPEVAAVHETAGPTQLTFGSITSGQILVRSGTTIIGQTGSAPTGSAGGDLAGTYPNPTVTQARGLKSATTTVSVSAATAPTSGQVLTATGSTAATWQTPSGSPTGSAGGDLAGTYPNPTVSTSAALKSATTNVVTSASTAPSSGQVLTATSSTAASWQAPSSAPTGTAGGDLAGTYPNPSVVTSAALKSATTNVVTSAATAPVAGQLLTATASNAAQWQAAPRGTNPLLALSSSPDTWNLEACQMTNPDLAANGWTFTLGDSPWTTMTRTGNIDMSSSPGTTNYRSQLVGGFLVIQLQPNDFCTLYKSTVSTAKTYKAHVWPVQYGIGATVDTAGTADIMISDNTHRAASGARTYFHGVNAGNQQEFLMVGPSTFTSFTNTALKADNGQDVVTYIHNPASSNQMGAEQFTGLNGIQTMNNGVPSLMRTVTITPTIAGLWLFGNASNNTLIFFDFIRRGTYLDRFC